MILLYILFYVLHSVLKVVEMYAKMTATCFVSSRSLGVAMGSKQVGRVGFWNTQDRLILLDILRKMSGREIEEFMSTVELLSKESSDQSCIASLKLPLWLAVQLRGHVRTIDELQDGGKELVRRKVWYMSRIMDGGQQAINSVESTLFAEGHHSLSR